MIDIIGQGSHAFAALLFGALAVWQLRRWNLDFPNQPLVAAFAAMAMWAIFQAIFGHGDLGSCLAESARNLAFLTFMYGILHNGAEERPKTGVKIVYGAVAAVVAVQIIIALLLGYSDLRTVLAPTWNGTGATVAAGSLVLVHNLYAHAARSSRRNIRLPMIALAAMWAYDLHLYTVAYLTRNGFDELFALRGVMAIMLAPLFAVATRRTAEWHVQMSRMAAFRSISVAALLAYFILMISAVRAVAAFDAAWAWAAQLGVVLAMTVTALILLPSFKIRAWLRVAVAKHLFEHRYDYREDWLRFTRTVGHAGEDGSAIEERVVKALAEISGASGGLLLSLSGEERLNSSAQWNWPFSQVHGEAGLEFVRFLERTSYVLDFAAVRAGALKRKGVEIVVPEWLAAEGDGWAGVPLVHNDRLVGIVMLGHPTPPRPLDWEDYDLFRTVGMQAASYLAEAQSQEALGEARRFDEFNRRFAFILHDIKNLVSQLTLVTRNAERHADNPEFRADMIATLQASVKKMNDLLAKLAGKQPGDVAPPSPLRLLPFVADIAASKQRSHAVSVDCDETLTISADPGRLEQALTHLLQNAIEATANDEPVRLVCHNEGAEVTIAVEDSGAGMSSEFIRTRLFQPFASTKESGFGIGAFEARTLIASMGGRIEVESREGEGSRFTIYLPAAQAGHDLQSERMCA